MHQSVRSDPAARQSEDGEIGRVAQVFGGKSVLGQIVRTPLQAHELLVGGLPAPALHHLVDNVALLGSGAALESALGLSLRTLQRSRTDPGRALSPDQSGRAWKFAEVLSLATDVLGSQELAERWLDQPALALEGHRPIDLMSTPAGVELVETLLRRLEYGVYT